MLLYAVSTVLSGLLQKAPKASASAMGDLKVPTAEEGRNLPVIWGTCMLRAPNVVWYGDYKCVPIKKSMGIMAFGRSYTAGYQYFLTMDLGLCHGKVDALVAILAGTGEDLKSLGYPMVDLNPDGSIRLHALTVDLFGGEDAEGGIAGWGTFYPGSDTQESDSYMSAMLGLTYPAYRNVCHIVCEQWYLGTSPYIKNLAFKVRRCPSNLGLSGAQTNLSGDANPAEIIYECLQGKAWGLGFPAARIDAASFRAAGVTLAAEGMGMALMLDSPQQADHVIETVLQHIDAVCYTDPSTGLWTLKLIRPDYVPALLPAFGPDAISECEFSRGSWEDTLNEVKVTYTDGNTWKQGMVQAQESANFAARLGDKASTTLEFPGFSNATIAQKVCNREMRTFGYPMGKGRVKINRTAWALRMGSPFRLSWPPLGIESMCVRVTSIDYGTLTAGEIEIEFCEDVFMAGYSAYGAPTGSGWTDPIGSEPVPPAAQLVQEVPYQVLGAADRRLLVGAVRGDGASEYYDVWTDDGDGYYETTTVDLFTPRGLLATAYPRTTAATDPVGFVIGGGTDLESLVNTDAAGRTRGDALLIIVDADGRHEWCAWQTCSNNGDGTYTIAPVVRGIFDTVQIDHAGGASVYFVSDGGAYNTAITRDGAYVADQLVHVKCLPHNPAGTCVIGTVAAVSVQTASRAQLPYPPGDVKIAGQSWPNGAHLGAVAVPLTWAHRHRTAQAGCTVVAQDAASVAGGPEGTYTVEVLIDGVVKRTQAGIAGTSYTYLLADRLADDADAYKPVQFRITPVNGALVGTKRTTDPFLMAP